ncbi:MAG: response regulator [Aulosira sp. ZfuCHP01]|nr:response regulator [Aulosira sp. DedVER01a]MDZ8052788.1 response regulator [Aulosira sp. ZfuCHP01]
MFFTRYLSNASDPSIPLIICSADARSSTRQQAMQADAQAFFIKPIDFDLLVEAIAQLIKRSCVL